MDGPKLGFDDGLLDVAVVGWLLGTGEACMDGSNEGP
jgi:hypothetical protein